MKIIFIGGTGRSGTTVLSKIFGQNKGIYVLPKELRFITDPDGILSLKYNIVDNWSHYNADFAIFRFINLLNRIFFNKYGTYPKYNLSGRTNFDSFNDWLSTYLDNLGVLQYKASWFGRRNFLTDKTLAYFGKNLLTKKFLPNTYFVKPQTEEEFYKISREFLKSFFKEICHNSEDTIVDHTPSNILHAKELVKLFPNIKLIHIKRHPLDVISSFSKQKWASTDYIDNLKLLEGIYMRWEEVKKFISNDNFHEIYFEDLINNQDNELENLKRWTGLSNLNIGDLNLSHHNIGKWKQFIDKQTLNTIQNEYSDFIERTGYLIS